MGRAHGPNLAKSSTGSSFLPRRRNENGQESQMRRLPSTTLQRFSLDDDPELKEKVTLNRNRNRIGA